MKVDGTGAINYPAGYETKYKEKHAFGTGFLNGAKDKEAPEQAALPRQVQLMDIYNKMKRMAGNGEPVPLQAGGKGQEQEVGHPAKGEGTDGKASTEIIVKPDGSRVLVMTMCIGGMETSMCLEISKPTDMPNSAAQVENGGAGQGIACRESFILEGRES